MAVDASGVEILSPERSMQLLAAHTPQVGRVGLPGEGAPVVLPVNYRIVDGEVVLRTAIWTQLYATAMQRRWVAFEVDAVDPLWEDGWSVLVRGPAREVTDPERIHHLRTLPLRAWVSVERTRYVTISPSKVTGRRLG